MPRPRKNTELLEITPPQVIDIAPAKFERMTVPIIGTAPLVQNKFSEKAKQELLDGMAEPKQKKRGKARKARDYDAEFMAAQHLATDGWNGHPASAFRSAMIRACSAAGVVMTQAKLALFIVPDGFDQEDATPLVRILSAHDAEHFVARASLRKNKAKEYRPEKHTGPVRNSGLSTDIRVRPMWREWGCRLTIEYDADMMTPSTIINLLARAGRQVGIGEGRVFSPKSLAGMGWGTWDVLNGGVK